MSDQYVAMEHVRDPDGRIITVATSKAGLSVRGVTRVSAGEELVGTYGDYLDDGAAFEAHRRICRAVRLGHALNEEVL